MKNQIEKAQESLIDVKVKLSFPIKFWINTKTYFKNLRKKLKL